MLSDGKYSYSCGILATQLNHLISEGKMEAFTIVRILKFVVNRVAIQGKDQKKFVILIDLEPLVPGKEVN